MVIVAMEQVYGNFHGRQPMQYLCLECYKLLTFIPIPIGVITDPRYGVFSPNKVQSLTHREAPYTPAPYTYCPSDG